MLNWLTKLKNWLFANDELTHVSSVEMFKSESYYEYLKINPNVISTHEEKQMTNTFKYPLTISQLVSVEQPPAGITEGFEPGAAYECLTSNTSQFEVGGVYMGVRTGKVDEMVPTTGVVSDRARVFNTTKSTFKKVGMWCSRPTKKSKDPYRD